MIQNDPVKHGCILKKSLLGGVVGLFTTVNGHLQGNRAQKNLNSPYFTPQS